MDPFSPGLEGIYDDAPLETHREVLKKAGFHTGPPNRYEGRPTPENEAAWKELMSVGMIAITEQEHARMPRGGTAALRDGHGIVPGNIKKRLRELIWDAEKGEAEHWQFGHASHCIDYLRQSLMCHGDLTPIYMLWSDEHQTYMGVQENIMQCRSWDAIVKC
ncbi:hypothetical protein C8035_v004414 [Colletotrichum spinosum]|uniref:Oxidase ustYa n=1 Tax=Colletotrichum spinosum TaxID=1347390 RepID=A0A4R8PLW8_9PEZI|nr:hypothetical protein C8035_v004414 [Colletotrichum spinosum]